MENYVKIKILIIVDTSKGKPENTCLYMNNFDNLGKQINSKINMYFFPPIPDIESECYMQILFFLNPQSSL